MLKKQVKIVVTFSNTTDAMMMESVCLENNVPGRMISAPKVISAGLGLAWSSDSQNEKQIRNVLKISGLNEEGMYKCVI